MITQELLIEPVIKYDELFPRTVDEFLDTFRGVIDLDIETGITLDFLIDPRESETKIAPKLVLAEPEQAKDVVEIFEEVYNQSYPYLDFLDEEKVEVMIQSIEYNFILFMMDKEIGGCFKCYLDFDNRKGYIGALMVKKKYQGILDFTKAIIGSSYWAFSIYREVIDIWYCENRTAHASSQYSTGICGLNTLAVFPNKDVFYNQVETDVLCVNYSENALDILRKRRQPQLIRNALESYIHSDGIYHLGGFQIVEPQIKLNFKKIRNLQENYRMDIIKDKYGYEFYQCFIKESSSYFLYLHTTTVQNFEKIKYHVESLEELYVYLTELKRSMLQNNIRYVEVFVSAYNPEQQQIFYNFGFRARGYTPAWSYNKISGEFEDQIVFNYYEGKVEHIQLLPQGWELLDLLNIKIK
ncbi:MAG: hypothetical protein EAX89_06530 [Candidatus Lokiarchaeota archaeon]|nr:hypothetical protein [Candidatus Lokiarchaeota archaeon]